MRRRTTEEAIPAESGNELTVRRFPDRVNVTWTCGDSVDLNWSRLTEAIAYVEMFDPDVWTYQQSSDGTGFSTRLDGDRLYISPGDVRSAGIEVVHWSELKAALEEAKALGTDEAADDESAG